MQNRTNAGAIRGYSPEQPAQPVYQPAQPVYQPAQPAYQPPQPAYQPPQPAYQPPQPVYQQPQEYYAQPVERRGNGLAAFFKRRDMVLLIGAALALAWLIFSYMSVAEVVNSVPTGDSAEALGAQVGTALGLALLVPYFIVTALGVIFDWLGWLLNKRGFALTAAILFCVALPLGIGNAVGLIPSIVLGFVGYARLKKRQTGQQ